MQNIATGYGTNYVHMQYIYNMLFATHALSRTGYYDSFAEAAIVVGFYTIHQAIEMQYTYISGLQLNVACAWFYVDN